MLTSYISTEKKQKETALYQNCDSIVRADLETIEISYFNLIICWPYLSSRIFVYSKVYSWRYSQNIKTELGVGIYLSSLSSSCLILHDQYIWRCSPSLTLTGRSLFLPPLNLSVYVLMRISLRGGVQRMSVVGQLLVPFWSSEVKRPQVDEIYVRYKATHIEVRCKKKIPK